jgi:hypothetical protein
MVASRGMVLEWGRATLIFCNLGFWVIFEWVSYKSRGTDICKMSLGFTLPLCHNYGHFKAATAIVAFLKTFSDGFMPQK